MKSKTLAYIGTYAKWEMHQMIDVCFLHTCALVADKVVCYKDVTTLDYVKAMGREHGFNDRVVIKRIHIIRSKNRFLEFLGFLYAAILNIVLYLRNCRKDYIVYNYDNVFSLHVINFLNRIFSKKVVILCHDEMELLITNSGGGFAKLKRKLVRNFFGSNRIEKNMEFVVLGESICKNLRNVLPESVHSHFHSIEHPYYFHTIIPKEQYNRPQNIGLVGVISESKGLNDFISFVNLVSELSLKVDIKVIGRISTHQYDKFFKDKQVDITWKYLPRDEMERRIAELDYILYFYPKDSYKLIASGAVFDAVCMNKPILAIRNDFFEHVLHSIGYPSLLVDDVEELADFVKQQKPLSYDINQYKGVDLFSPEANSKLLRQILELPA
jgi:glycosyltransferase involved in cell wall biosynthesis